MHAEMKTMKNEAPQINADDVQRGLENLIGKLFRDDQGMEIRVIREYWAKAKDDRPEGFRSFAESHFFKVGDTLKNAAKYLAKWNSEPGVNIYFAVNPRREIVNDDGEVEPAETDNSRRKLHIYCVVSLHVDLDDIKPDEAKAMADELGLEMIWIGSGSGSHGYLLLAVPITIESPEDVAKAERLIRRLMHAFGQKTADKGADATQDITRILRVPGLINWPNEKKRKKGRKPSLCYLAHTTDKRYSVEELEELLPELPEQMVSVFGPSVPVNELTRTDVADAVFHGGFDSLPKKEKNKPTITPEQAQKLIEETDKPERFRRIEAYVGGIVKKDSKFWKGQSERGTRARKLVHVSWMFGIDIKEMIAWARERGAAIREPEYWARYQRRYLEPHNPFGFGLASNKSGIYLVKDGAICRIKRERSGNVTIPLSNFDARIIEAIVRDDGVETTTLFKVEGSLASGRTLPPVEVPVEQFGSMNWTEKLANGKAVVLAGQGNRDHLRAAIKILSDDYPECREFTHLGWRKVNGSWVYLHAGGAIGRDGPVENVVVAVDGSLRGYELPTSPKKEEVATAIRASLELLNGLATDATMMPLFAAIWRSALGSTDFSLFFLGKTGVFKTEIAALSQQHLGSAMNARNLPANWDSTANAIQAIAFGAKDSLFVIDDFNPKGSSNAIAQTHREADKIFRSQGNSQGRQRMRADLTLRPEKPPRGLILATGEDVPRGHSCRARMLVIEVADGEVDTAKLTQCQNLSGQFATAMAGYVRWLAPRYEEIRKNMPKWIAEARNEMASEGLHARTPDIAASLLYGMETFLKFVKEVGAVDDQQADKLRKRGEKAIRSAAREQGEHQSDADPATQFLNLIQGLLSSGRGHLYGVGGHRPDNAKNLGWRLVDNGDNGDTWRPQGRLIGWIDEHEEIVFLEPESAFAEAQRFAADQGATLPIDKRTMNKRLKERGVLAATDSNRSKILIRKRIDGVSKYVLALKQDALALGDHSALIDEPEPEAEPRSAIGTIRWATKTARRSATPPDNGSGDDGDDGDVQHKQPDGLDLDNFEDLDRHLRAVGRVETTGI